MAVILPIHAYNNSLQQLRKKFFSAKPIQKTRLKNISLKNTLKLLYLVLILQLQLPWYLDSKVGITTPTLSSQN